MRPRGARYGGALVVACAAAAGIPAASLGDDPAGRAAELRHADAALAGEQRSGALELYSIEHRLAAAAAGVAALDRRRDATERELEAVAARRAAARATLAQARRLLALRLRTLYEAGETDPMALFLDAGSLEEALDGLEGLRFAAEQDREIIGRSYAARRQLARLAHTLAARRGTLLRLRAEAASRVEELGRAAAARRAYLDRLAEERGLNQRRLAAVQSQARTAEAETQRLSAPATPAASAASGPTTPGTLTVVALGYSLDGSTATGLPAGWGVVAVDPGVIPLGTRLSIPGYGDGVAADTGSGVQGATIDLWFPTRTQALAWGARTVKVTLRP